MSRPQMLTHQVGGHDEGGVLAHDGLASAVGQPAFVKELQQNRQDIWKSRNSMIKDFDR